MNKSKIISLTLCLLMALSYAAPSAFAQDPVLIIWTEQNTYEMGDDLVLHVTGGRPWSIVQVQFEDHENVVRWVVQGMFDEDGAYVYTLMVPNTWDDGTWTVKVRNEWLTGSHQFQIINTVPPGGGGGVPNQNPVARITVDKTSTWIGDLISFDASGSSDADGTITAYAWNFGDGGSSSAKTISHFYAAAGTYTATLTVTDNLGAKGSATVQISISEKENEPPVANAGSDRNAFVNKTVTFSGLASTDSDGTIVTYAWEFGDTATGSGATQTHKYAAAGTYTVTLKVTDNRGATDSDTLVVTVEALPAEEKNESEGSFHGSQTNAVLDATGTMGVKVKLNTTDDVNVYLIEYETNPHPEAPKPKNMLNKWFDISISDPDAVSWPLYVEVHYTDADVAGLDESSLVLYYFSEGSWHICSNTGVDTVNNFIWAYLTREEAGGSPLTIGKLPTAAAFQYSNIQVSPAQVDIGATVTVQVTVKNIGDLDGTTKVDLFINDVKDQTKQVTLAGGASTTLSFSVSKTTPVAYAIKIGELTGTFTVKAPLKPAAFSFSGMTVSPASVAPGTEVTVSATVKNTGEQSGSYSAEFKLDGTSKETKTGTLAAGATATVTFKASSQAQGAHTVLVGDQTGTFNVTAPPPPAPDYTLYYIGGVVVVVLIVAVFLMTRKPTAGA